MHSIINKPVEIWSGAVPRFEKCYGHGHSGLPREPASGYGPLAADSRQLEHEVDWTTVPHIIDVKKRVIVKIPSRSSRSTSEVTETN